MSHPYKSSPQKTTHHVVAVGVFFGLIPSFFRLTRQAKRLSGFRIAFVTFVQMLVENRGKRVDAQREAEAGTRSDENGPN